MGEFITPDGRDLSAVRAAYEAGDTISEVMTVYRALMAAERATSDVANGGCGVELCQRKPILQPTGNFDADRRGNVVNEVEVIGFDWFDCGNSGCETSVRNPDARVALVKRLQAEARSTYPVGTRFYTRGV